MEVESILSIVNTLWPLMLGLITLVIVLSKMHYSIEVLKEKVKILFDFHNNRDNDGK
jgi:hypothetical protein